MRLSPWRHADSSSTRATIVRTEAGGCHAGAPASAPCTFVMEEYVIWYDGRACCVQRGSPFSTPHIRHQACSSCRDGNRFCFKT
eukprot:2689617-Pyramimonas_sp.AAC.1